jgi:hypothetical protein
MLPLSTHLLVFFFCLGFDVNDHGIGWLCKNPALSGVKDGLG